MASHRYWLVAAVLIASGLLICARPSAAHDGMYLPGEIAVSLLDEQGEIERAGARIWYGSAGRGDPVIMLHGGMSSHLGWAKQIPALVARGHRVILIDSRGHGRSTLGELPLDYDLLADDVAAVIARLRLRRPAIVGWSDGGIVALNLAMRRGAELGRIVAFGANMNRAAVRPGAADAPILRRVGPRLAADYAALSPTPGNFAELQRAVRAMQASQRDTARADLAAIRGRDILIIAGEKDEFIQSSHSRWLSRCIPRARLVTLRGTGHFAPWETPEAFNRAVADFLGAAPTTPGYR